MKFFFSLCALTLLSSQSLLAQEEGRGEGRVRYFRVTTAETCAGEPVQNAVLMVRDGVLEKVGAAVMVPKDAKVIDLRKKGAIATPPLALAAYSISSDRRGRGNHADKLAKDSLWLSEDWGDDYIQGGVLWVGVTPPGSGIPGRTCTLRADAETPVPEVVLDDVQLCLTMEGAGRMKSLLRDAIEKAESAIQAEKDAEIAWRKEREAWEAEQKAKEEAAKKEASKKEGAEKGGKAASEEAKKEEEKKAPPEKFEPPKLKDSIRPLVEWLRGERVALVSLASASDWLHWTELIRDRKVAVEFKIVSSWRGDSNFYEVLSSMAQTGARLHLPSAMQFQVNTRNRLNLPFEAVSAGFGKIVLSPKRLGSEWPTLWREHVSHLVAEGLDRTIALKAMTVEPAASMGLLEESKGLVAGAPAHFVIWDGDPLNPLSQVLLVVADGKVIWDREKDQEDRS